MTSADGFPVDLAPPPLPQEQPPPFPPRAGKTTAPKRPANYLVLHWRGELPLAQSYWVNVFGLNMLLRILIGVLVTPLKGTLRPGTSIALLVITAIVLSAIATWQAVGTWRSASVHGGGWAVMAKLTSVINVLSMGWLIVTYSLLIGQLGHVASEQGKWDNYVIAPSADGTAVEANGYIGVGFADKVAEIFTAHPGAKVLRIDSLGGSVEDGFALNAFLKGHPDIAIEAKGNCMSACTIAFMGAGQRLLGPRAMLGFHHMRALVESTFNTAHVIKDEDTFRRILIDHGASPEFVRKAFEFSGEHVYAPDMVALVDNGIATGLVMDGRPAERGAWLTARYLALFRNDPQHRVLAPLFARIPAQDPASYAHLPVDEERASHLPTQEARLSAYIDGIWSLLNHAEAHALSTAPDTEVLAYGKAQAALLTFLRDRVSPLQCGTSLRGETLHLGDRGADYFALREQADQTIMSGHVRQPLSVAEWRAGSLALQKARADLPKVSAGAGRLDHAQYATVCMRGLTTVQRLIALPPAEGSAALRLYF
jgi:hypothetical protein